MKKILWISAAVPYDSVPHAGGQIHNFYLKQLHALKKYDIRLISFFTPDSIKKIDLDNYQIMNKLVCRKQKGLLKIYWGGLTRLEHLNPLDKYVHLSSSFMEWGVLKCIKEYKKENFAPDVIIMQWTQIVLLLPEIKKIYPEAKIISIEEDVSFQSYERRMNSVNGVIHKALWKYKYNQLKSKEIHCLEMSDLVINNNEKDEKILLENSSKIKTWRWAPYFHSMISNKRENNSNKDILYYGAMDREENWKSAIWFIKNVFHKINDPEVRFVIVGNRPHKELKKYASERIKILGFVEDVTPLFQKSMCLVAPLVLGAGIKIKILEGLSSGIPVLTNSIGIEGISAQNGRDFFFCESPDEYVTVIYHLLDGSINQNIIEMNSKRFISDRYNFKRDVSEFARLIDNL